MTRKSHNSTNPRHCVRNRVKVKYNKIWISNLDDDKENKSSGNKLRTYRLFKRNICFEAYLLNGNISHRNVLKTKFRISIVTI